MSAELTPQLASIALRNAFPYLRLFQGKTFVIKAGGEAFVESASTTALLEQVSLLHRLGIRIVLVHGGGPQISEISERMGVDVEFVEGRRVTCAETLKIATMALNGTVRTGIVAALRDLETRAVGLSGVDGDLITAQRRPPAGKADGTMFDSGHVGDIETVDTRLIQELLDAGYLPVVSSLSADDRGNLLNVNADVAAARLAVALGADKMIFLTGASGILEDPADPSSLISFVDLAGLTQLHERGCLAEGMLPKVASIADALRGGVSRVHVISHKQPDTLLIEIFTNDGSGTLIVRDKTDQKSEKESA